MSIKGVVRQGQHRQGTRAGKGAGVVGCGNTLQCHKGARAPGKGAGGGVVVYKSGRRWQGIHVSSGTNRRSNQPSTPSREGSTKEGEEARRRLVRCTSTVHRYPPGGGGSGYGGRGKVRWGRYRYVGGRRWGRTGKRGEGVKTFETATRGRRKGNVQQGVRGSTNQRVGWNGQAEGHRRQRALLGTAARYVGSKAGSVVRRVSKQQNNVQPPIRQTERHNNNNQPSPQRNVGQSGLGQKGSKC